MARLNHILTQLARQHIPHTIGQDLDARALATELARYGVLVLVADVPPRLASRREDTINDWIGQVGDLYYVLARALFPSLKEIRAVYADDRLPPIIVISAKSDMITRTLAGYIVPYVAARSDSEYSPLEVRGVVSAMLESLSVDKMPDVNFVALRDACMLQVKHLLALPLKHTSLTDFDQPLLANWQGSTPPEPTPPPDLPEVAGMAPTPKDDLFKHPLPLFFKKRDDNGDDAPRKPRPPVPPPPKR
jgi:hypothetical protein